MDSQVHTSDTLTTGAISMSDLVDEVAVVLRR
jgi:hypothetical protein